MMTVKELLEEIEKLREFNDIDDMKIKVIICSTEMYYSPNLTTGELASISINGLTKRLVNNKWELIEEPYIELFGYE